MGQQYAAQINQQLPIVRDPEVVRYINVLGDSIARLADDRNLDWHFNVVDSPEINAFAVPGGYVYVNRGLIEHASNMSELAGVLGHEIGHVTLRHSMEQMRDMERANAGVGVLCVFTRVCQSQAAAAAINVGGSAVFAGFSREGRIGSRCRRGEERRPRRHRPARHPADVPDAAAAAPEPAELRGCILRQPSDGGGSDRRHRGADRADRPGDPAVADARHAGVRELQAAPALAAAVAEAVAPSAARRRSLPWAGCRDSPRRPARRILTVWTSRSPSPAPTPGAAPASRPTSRPSIASASSGRRWSPPSPPRTRSACGTGPRCPPRSCAAQLDAVAEDLRPPP